MSHEQQKVKEMAMRGKWEGRVESHESFQRFQSAIRESKPAVNTFTNAALVLLFICLGDDALRARAERREAGREPKRL